MTKISDLHSKWKHDETYQEAYDVLEDEFALAAALIEARSRAGLTQGELAERMRTTQSAVARIEGGHIPTIRTL
jgi:ribosome-binding protein aMBF1 (putative translation factor)